MVKPHLEDGGREVVRGPASDWFSWLTQHAESLCRLAAYSGAFLVAGTFAYHFAHHSPAYLGLLEDDYFYYATVADNLVTHGRLSYDGVTSTNGFHPLWFAVIALLRALLGRFGAAYYGGLIAVGLISACLTYELGRRFARQLGSSAAAAAVIAAVYAFATARLLANGMESTIAVPLMLWLLLELARPAEMTVRRSMRLGFIASLAVLARLDIGIAVAIAISGFVVLARPGFSEGLRLLLGFAGGGILVPLYALWNFIEFGSPLPVSALAKQLVVTRGFSTGYVRYLAFGTEFGPSIALILPLGFAALLLLTRQNPARRTAHFAGAVIMVFAGVFFFLNALSGWIFFGWYAYPLPAAAIAALAFIDQRFISSREQRRSIAIAACIVVAAGSAISLKYFIEHGPKWSVGDNALLATAYDLAAHMQQHRGLISMGAIAGVVGYVADRPLLQLEGILADAHLVEHIRRQDSLASVLAEYRADYLIVSVAGIPLEIHDGCAVITQPHAQWAGTRTAKMRGELCSPPIEHFYTEAGRNPWSVFPRVETFVWDLRNAIWRE
ncbi:MAG TPA: hypothetical protein VHS76_12095 [Steroidobacteraceae bacterium]|jgi:hypothetical protein|nr:hypothetical protein [Steroidobacteraceae bacterium]